jgi:hypothetical protein
MDENATGICLESLERPACGVIPRPKSIGSREGCVRYHDEQCRYDLECVVLEDETPDE